MTLRVASIQRTRQRPTRMLRLQPKALGRGRISTGAAGRRMRYDSDFFFLNLYEGSFIRLGRVKLEPTRIIRKSTLIGDFMF